MTTRTPDPEAVQRFAADLDALVEPNGRVGVAVSGGPDSLALLLLAASARPGLVEAATVDHSIRPKSRGEAEMVARLCGQIGIHHALLPADSRAPATNIQAWARSLRYRLLAGWASERDLKAVATAHHLDDQAETVLMRLARGSGVSGLAAIQPQLPLAGGIDLVRPLLGWQRAELARIPERAGLSPVADPSNADARFDRTRARALLEATDWLDPGRLAAAAANAADAETALGWVARREFEARSARDGDRISLDPSDLPRELRFRLLAEAIDRLGGEAPRGPKLAAALDKLDAGETTTLAGLKLEGGKRWRLSPAPSRKR